MPKFIKPMPIPCFKVIDSFNKSLDSIMDTTGVKEDINAI